MADKKSDANFYGYRSVDGVIKVLPRKFYGITAIVYITVIIILAVIPTPGAKGWGLTEKIIVVSALTLSGTPLLLFSFVLRYFLDS